MSLGKSTLGYAFSLVAAFAVPVPVATPGRDIRHVQNGWVDQSCGVKKKATFQCTHQPQSSFQRRDCEAKSGRGHDAGTSHDFLNGEFRDGGWHRMGPAPNGFGWGLNRHRRISVFVMLTFVTVVVCRPAESFCAQAFDAVGLSNPCSFLCWFWWHKRVYTYKFVEMLTYSHF